MTELHRKNSTRDEITKKLNDILNNIANLLLKVSGNKAPQETNPNLTILSNHVAYLLMDFELRQSCPSMVVIRKEHQQKLKGYL